MHFTLKDVLYYLSLYGVFKDSHQRWKKALKARKLRHPLTLPLPDGTPLPVYRRKKQPLIYQPQADSIFFVLPLELRREIYSYVFGGRPIKRPFAVRCTDWHRVGLHNHNEPQQPRAPQRIQWVDIIPIALLQTCRKIYSEAIDVFYSEAIFKAFTPVDVDRMFLGLPVQRTDCIRSIWIDIRFAITCSLQCDGLEEIFDEGTWSEVVKSLAKLPQLRNVRVSFMKDELTGGDYCGHLLERCVLPALAVVPRVPKYEFLVNFEVKTPDNVPFQVKRIRASRLRQGRIWAE
ncbi:hypothetical protein LOZ61_000537 [Ophidiomyces ophidiicola]|uniref:Uncharacterized protein n=1 Tax=Ophidiomyces ophidiicola TaxID=1387563 RepID=A0ACB8URR4_9EURO|nr:uncharacterized protein LOZ57_005027 [Ophidiomyces ophidiicola]KAI1917474.1 hypothetical protein LOZ61_000537 [Ophidiomyces ophidiicola]KAI1921580.1 hypothetical protein LOZ60_006130 [Ophidiomyces ophidiicola]KAI1943318.1 hypothetical protein LOZ57_005027 [Ophidiomyces ophidiicola]KAI1962691.1 hypothetical protein LOZ59_002027 [Ophidiomyces ophidiicola]KAI2054226.1 hypothetical protein LOZ43_004045 [Ophidiomyces ophidiicola]